MLVKKRYITIRYSRYKGQNTVLYRQIRYTWWACISPCCSHDILLN